MAYAVPLDELRRGDEPAFGGKSVGLGELLAAGIPVPPGFALSTRAFAAFMEQSGLAGRTELRGIGEAMRSAEVPDSVRNAVAEGYARLARAAGDAAPPVAVRSSAVGEDSTEATFAGLQESYLWVRGVEHVCDAVRDCWVSLFSPQATSYRERLEAAAGAPPQTGDPLKPGAGRPAMGVTIQLMVDADVSGVMFTCNPVSGDVSVVAINASWGLGLAVVGGEVTPDEVLLSKVTGEVVRERLADKAVQYVPDARGRGTVRVAVAEERRRVACLDREALAGLLELARRVEEHFGSHQDVEWALARSGGLFVVQSRPVTATGRARPQAPPPASAISLVLRTFGAGGEDAAQ